MLSFNALSERKTKIKLNPKLQDVQECPDEMDMPKKKVCQSCMGSGQKGGMECTQCEGKGFTMDSEMEEGYKGYSKGGEVEPPKERLKTDRNMFNIPKDEQDAARERLKAKAAAKRKQLNKEENAYVSQEEVSEESNQESDSEAKILTFAQFNEGRAEDAKKSLDAVKKRQGVLDAYEKKTGKKLDIAKTPEHKAHKQNFPGAKRQAKKVKGAKETSAEKHSREVQTYTDRLKKYGKTKKQAAYDKAMSKQTSRFD